jgi:hypothetical protein
MRRTLAVVLLALAVVAAAATLTACGLQDKAIENTSGKIDVAKDAAAKAELMMLNNGSAPADASQATLGGFVAPWPVNPFSKQPMAPGDAAGDYVYTPGAGTAYTLAVHLSDGSTYTAP